LAKEPFSLLSPVSYADPVGRPEEPIEKEEEESDEEFDLTSGEEDDGAG
jgi:hypothetical protein